MQNIQTRLGDCIEVMRTMRDNSIDSIVTDPPAGIAFMGKEWDKDKGGRDKWIEWMTNVASECLRVLKPGGHALVWALPRTSHWTATAWENAGFEVRDRIEHIFGSGFPKSMNISKQIDKMAGKEQKVIGKYQLPNGQEWNLKQSEDESVNGSGGTFTASGRRTLDITAPSTEEAQQWDGWGTALKPSVEDWWLFRKPISEKTVAENVLKWGTGAINIDACRVPIENKDDNIYAKNPHTNGTIGENGIYGRGEKTLYNVPIGRWPAQLIHDGSEEIISLFPETKSGAMKHEVDAYKGESNTGFLRGKSNPDNQRADSGSAARFFYCAKASRSERESGLEDLEISDRKTPMAGRGQAGLKCKKCGHWKASGNPCQCDEPEFEQSNFERPILRNGHPTVKPLALMRYLITLITPPNGMVLDPFLGSGSTLVAAKELGFSGRGIESDPEYIKIANKRIENVA